MEEEHLEGEANNKLYYLIGAVVLVAVVAVGYFLRPKPATQTSQQAPVAVVPTPTLGPIARLTCDTQYYNPVIGFEKYYLSVEGGDLRSANTVDCVITASVNEKVVLTKKLSSPLTDRPERSGKTFRCTTEGVELKAGVPTKVDVALKDNEGATATCSAFFVFPKP